MSFQGKTCWILTITQNRILSPLHSVTHASYCLLTFERGIPFILSVIFIMKSFVLDVYVDCMTLCFA